MSELDRNHKREQEMRDELCTGYTREAWVVGLVICPAREKCPGGLYSYFRPLKNGRLPMHRDESGSACPGARQKPTKPPLELHPDLAEDLYRAAEKLDEFTRGSCLAPRPWIALAETATVTASASVSTVFAEVPLRLLPEPRPAGSGFA